MLSFFQRDVLDEILDLIESVSEGFLLTLATQPFLLTVSYFESEMFYTNLILLQ